MCPSWQAIAIILFDLASSKMQGDEKMGADVDIFQRIRCEVAQIAYRDPATVATKRIPSRSFGLEKIGPSSFKLHLEKNFSFLAGNL